MTPEEIREAYRASVAETRRWMDTDDESDVDKANAITEERTASLAPLGSGAELVEMLSPLLHPSESEWVRLHAASYLLTRGHADLAVPTLEDLRDHAASTAQIRAEVLLERWKKSQTT